MRSVFLILSVSSFVLGQTTPDQTEGRPKYQRALTDLVPANLITVLDKYHRPITNNYEPPEPTKQKLTKAEILAKFTAPRSSTTITAPATSTTTTTTTTRKPSTYVTSYPTLSQTDEGTETPFRILFIQTTTPSGPGATDTLPPGYFGKVVTQTAKTVTVFEDGVAKTETVTPSPSQGTTLTSSNSANFSPVFIYKNHRFTSDSPSPVVSVASSVSTSDGELFKNNDEIKAQTAAGLQGSRTTPVKSSSTQRPRRKVIKVKSKKVLKGEKETEPIKTTAKPTEATKSTVESDKKKEPLTVRGSKTNAQRERPKVLITRRLTNPKSQTADVTTGVSTTPIPETPTEAPKKIRRPGGLRKPTAAPEAEKPTSEAPITTTGAIRPLFRSRPGTTRAPSTTAPTLRSVLPTTASVQFEPTKTPARRTTQSLSRTSPTTSSSTLSNTRLPETPTPSPQTAAAKEEKASTPRLSQKRVVTRIGTSRPVATTPVQTTPLPETQTKPPVTTESPAVSRNPKKIVKRKKKPAASTTAPEFATSDKTTVTPVSIIYFQTTRFTTPAPAVTEARRVAKKRRKKPSTPAGTVSTQPIPFSPTEPSTFSAPQAVTGFRPITTSNYFTTPEHLQHLPKTDEIAQVINLPGGRLSSYQARYTPQRPQEFLPSPDYGSAISNPLPQHIPRIPPNQRAIRPGPFTVDEFFANDPSYQDLQRLLVAETNRFHSQPRNSARFSPYRDQVVDYRSSK